MVVVIFQCDCCPRKTNGAALYQDEVFHREPKTAHPVEPRYRADLREIRSPSGWTWDGEKLRCWQCAEIGTAISADPPNPATFAEVIGDLSPEQARREACRFTYTNHRGETEERRVIPLGFWWGSTDWHPEPQILFRGWDLERDALRDFAVSGIVNGKVRFGKGEAS